jgi:nucleoside-diphosphate-sugar epimerase
MSVNKKALITGATGVVGRNLLRYLSRREDWEIVSLSRRRPDLEGRFQHLAIDLLDRAGSLDAMQTLDDVTHIFHAAYIEKASWSETVTPNLAMLVNVVDGIEAVAGHLKHVHLIQGTKYYGSHLGPFKTPAKETDPRHMPPNFYYDQEDFIKARCQGKSWTWTAARPHAICGFATGNPMNLATVIAVYATLSKELGMPLCHPGTPGNYNALYQCTDAEHLSKAIIWMATEPECANQAFNITNGDYFRWKDMWPAIARYFKMELGPQRHIKLNEMMADKGPVWDRIVDKYGLKPYTYEEIVAWPYGDFVFTPEYDIMSDMTKARQYGFHNAVDTEDMFFRLFDEFRQNRIIP